MRLIDADDFFERMKNDTDICAEMEKDGLEALKKYLDMQPTVYDVDKVVEQLNNYPHGDYINVETMKDITEIVKAGGIANECGRYENSYNSNSDEPCRRCIPKEIVDKIEQRNALKKEIYAWCMENLDIEGMDPDIADITDYYTGEEQGDDGRDEWCDQTCLGEDRYVGEYYWETEYEGKYLHMTFNC